MYCCPGSGSVGQCYWSINSILHIATSQIETDNIMIMFVLKDSYVGIPVDNIYI